MKNFIILKEERPNKVLVKDLEKNTSKCLSKRFLKLRYEMGAIAIKNPNLLYG